MADDFCHLSGLELTPPLSLTLSLLPLLLLSLLVLSLLVLSLLVLSLLVLSLLVLSLLFLIQLLPFHMSTTLLRSSPPDTPL